jgi:hypothetical protein
MQHAAVDKLDELEKEYGSESVAFELLGPPRLSKLLHEINLLRKVGGGMKTIAQMEPAKLSEKVSQYVNENRKLRSEIISIGIPILLPDGKNMLRGNEIKIPPFRGENELKLTNENIDKWAYDGWVDLREKNMKVWIDRLNAIITEAESIKPDDTSSMHVRTKKYWNNFEKIDIGKVVGWIFIKEEKGERMKA